MSHNLLEWACWADQILSVIIFKNKLNFAAQNQNSKDGTILISIYRKQDELKNVIYKRLKEILKRIYERYEDPKIVIGGDFND